MHYLFLVYPDDTPPDPNRDAFDAACRANDAALRLSGYLLAAATFRGRGGSLQDAARSRTAPTGERTAPTTTLRFQNGELSLADGPSTGSGEQPGTLYVVDARDLNEAIRLAADMPQARRGRIEITLLADFAGPE